MVIRRLQAPLWIAALGLGLAACGAAAPTATHSAAAAPTTVPAATATAAAPAATIGAPTPGASGAPGGGSTAPATATALRQVTPMSAYPSVVHLAATNLAKELNIAPDQVEIRSATQTEWSDSSLGCPEPGRAYMQVITPGYKVILFANGREYEYHTNMQNMAIRCPK